MKLFQLVTFIVISCTRTAAASQRVGESLLEAARYSSYPPTVFAPGGRLYGVERVAKEALLLDGADDDAVSCGTFALHCGRNKSRRSDVEDVVTPTTSEYLFFYLTKEKKKKKGKQQ